MDAKEPTINSDSDIRILNYILCARILASNCGYLLSHEKKIMEKIYHVDKQQRQIKDGTPKMQSDHDTFQNNSKIHCKYFRSFVKKKLC